MRKLIFRVGRILLCWYVIKIDLNIMIVSALNIEKNFHKESFPALESVTLKTGTFNETKYIFMIFLCVVFSSFELFLFVNCFHITN